MSGEKQKDKVKKTGTKNNKPGLNIISPANWWNRTANINKILAGATVALVIIGSVGIYFSNWQYRQSHRPNVIFSRPIELLDPLTCDLESGNAHTGRMRIWLKNIGNAQANGVFPPVPDFKFVPEKRSGDQEVDRPPSITEDSCKQKLLPGAKMFPMYPGQELSVEIRQSVAKFPPLGGDAIVQLYSAQCVYYSDEYSTDHGTCTTYRLILPNGEPSFVCSIIRLTGKFQMTLTGHCEN
jgi:hypothetical protein